jgi:DNA repair exonuclease SbcCD ATPase subunit
VQTIQADTTKLQNSNYLIQQSMKVSGEYQAVQNIINKTTEQITTIKTALEEKNQSMIDMQNLCVVYSIEGVKQKVINNYLPLLNKEIAQNLDLLNFPYQLEFDSKFDPNLKDIGMPVPVDTLSDGEMTRVDIVVLCSLFKLLKRRYPNINILSIDELVSFLDVANSQILLKFLNNFAKSMNLNIFVVSHVNIDTECFDKCIEVTREENRFAHIREENLMM